jgi:hypothetical protein
MDAFAVLYRFATPDWTPWTVDEVMAALEPYESQVIPALIEALHSDDHNLQLLALRIIREYGPSALPAVSAVIAILRNGDRLLRSVAVTALGEIGPGARAALPWMLQMTESEGDFIEALAIRSVIQVEPSFWMIFIPRIKQHLGNDNELVRSETRAAMEAIGKG